MKYSLLILLFSLIPLSTQSQIDKNYIILTVDYQSMGNVERDDIYFWIAAVEDLESSIEVEIDFIPFYLQDYSRQNLIDCSKGKSVDIFTYYSNTDFDFTPDFLKDLQDFNKYILENRILLQTIKKKWPNNNKHVVKIFATEVNASVCECPGSGILLKGSIPFKKIALPFPNFNYSAMKSSPDLMNKLSNMDFSRITYPNKL